MKWFEGITTDSMRRIKWRASAFTRSLVDGRKIRLEYKSSNAHKAHKGRSYK